MKEMFLIIFTCVMFMMVLGGHPNDTLFTHYCGYLDVDKFSSCLQKTFSNQVKTAFYDCVHAIAVNIRYPKEIQYFFCNQATKQQIKDFEECLHMKLTYRQMDIYNNKFAKLYLYFTEMFGNTILNIIAKDESRRNPRTFFELYPLYQ
ncbi:uncharacterized protein LOC111627604 isoform X3 [Centruroides sculpturatus]|uniref:uncharacterized protein LOC111627604 isoform X3 n=1 Tax=Centruroides sculpturatus TaxID=218467 RepID=UPI000C6DD284|nr:uncharacterized protein LOC111627604 isoform X3 [Centruroides sculpturatus]